MAQIDSLDIQIQANAQSAAAAIDKLIVKLNTLEMHLNRVGGSKFGKQMEDAAKSLSKMAATASASSKGMGEIAAGTEKAASSMKTLPGAVSSFSSSLGKATKMSNSFAATFGRLYANFFWLRRLFQKGLGAIEIASDLTEVQNVVDVTFGKMNYKLDEFAKTSRQVFGLSELSAKQYASQFQAMFTAMGMTAGQVSEVHDRLANDAEKSAYAMSKGYNMVANSLSDMSLNLTKLAADMGSFFNQNPEDVAKRLQSGVVSGQSRALRQYGLDLTMATLQEWALKNGIDANVQSMTQAEKTMLRYQYVMSNMSMVMGDFSRTSMTWANQVKLLKQNFQALGAVIGRALIGWIKPAIIAINNAMNTIIGLVEKAVNAIGKLMGWQVEISGVSADFAEGVDEAVGGLEDAADGAGDTAGGLGKANKAAKELKKTILGFDELNVLNGADKDADDGGSGGSGGSGAGGGGASGGGGTFRPPTGGELTKYKSDIGSWFELGDRISETLSEMMEKINWERIYEKARRFGTGLADFLNGLINPRLFGNLGRTIANSLNTALEFLNSFGTRFSWKNFGESIVAGINKFFENFNFSLLASTINTFVHGILDTIITAINKTKWEYIGQRIGHFLAQLDFVGVGKKVGKLIWSAINAGIKFFKGMLNTAPVETALIGAFAGLNIIGKVKPLFRDLVKVMEPGITTVGTFFNHLGAGNGIGEALLQTFPKLKGVVGGVADVYEQFLISLGSTKNPIKALSDSTDVLLGKIPTLLQKIGGIGAGFAEFKVVETSMENIIGLMDDSTASVGDFLIELGKIAGVVTIAEKVMTAAFGFPAGTIAVAIIGIIGAIKGVNDAIAGIKAEAIGYAVRDALIKPGGVELHDVVQHVAESIGEIGDSFENLNSKAQNIESANAKIRETSNSIDTIKIAMDTGAISTEEGVQRMKDALSELSETTKTKMKETESYLSEVFNENGYLGQIFKQLGVNLDATREAIVVTAESAQKEVERIDAELELLYSKEVKSAEDTAQIKFLEDLRAAISGNSDEIQTSLTDLGNFIDGLDFNYEKMYDTEGKIDVEKFRSVLQEGANALSDTEKQIKEAKTHIETNLQSMYDTAIALGDEKSAEEIRKSMEVIPRGIEMAEGDATDALLTMSDNIQRGWLEETIRIGKEAEKYWDENGPVRGFKSKDEYVLEAIDDFKTNMIAPLEKALEEEYGSLAKDGAGWATSAVEEMIDGMTDAKVYKGIDENGQEITSYTVTVLNDGWEGIATEITPTIIEEMKKAGKAFPEGFGLGISENKKLGLDEAGLLGKEAAGILRAELKVNSPSKVTEDIGQWVVEGFIQGIQAKIQAAVGKVKEWMLQVSKQLLDDLSDLGKNALHDVSTNLKNVATEAKSKVADMQTWMSEGYDKITRITTDTFNSIYNTISEKIESAKSVVSTGLNAIQGFFSSMRLEFPQIKMPHFEMGTQTKSFLGQDIILPKIDVQWYAQGGFPEDGLFFANHHELVGQFSNGRTAVANNEQIIEGIQGGVTRAIVQYLPEIIRDAVSAADTGGGDIYIGDEQVARAAQRGQQKIDKRYNPSIQYG